METHENGANGERDGERAYVFIQSGGKDFPSPFVAKCNNQGVWKLFEFSSIYTGVKADKDVKDF